MVTDEQKQTLSQLADGLARPPRTPILRTPSDYGLAYEEVSFTTADGVEIKGWFIPGGERIVISNHFSPGNRYGFAGHLDGMGFAGGFEVNFLPRYRALHDAGYGVLAYDLRSHGESGEGDPPVSGVGAFEWQEVLASLDYVRNRPDTAGHAISMMSMCMGANATINAMGRKPEAFADVRALIAVNPLKGQTYIERVCEQMQIPQEDGVAAFDDMGYANTGLRYADHDVVSRAENVSVPVFYLQVRDDMNSRWTDVQELFDHTPVDDKKVAYVEDTPWRFRGYQHFSDHPAEMVEWFDAHR